MSGYSAPRSRIDHGQGETVIHLPIERSPISIVWNVLFILFWGVGGLFAVALLLAAVGDKTFYNVWLIGWAVGMAVMVVRLFWTLFGQDRLIVRSTGMTHIRSIFFFRLKQEFSSAEAREVRFLADDLSRNYRVNGRRIPQTALQIWNGHHRVSLGRGIKENEAQAAIAAIRMRAVQQGRRK